MDMTAYYRLESRLSLEATKKYAEFLEKSIHARKKLDSMLNHLVESLLDGMSKDT